MNKIIFHTLFLVVTANSKYISNLDFSAFSKPIIMLIAMIFFLCSGSIVALIIDSFLLNSLNILIASISQYFDLLVNLNILTYINYPQGTLSDITITNHLILNHNSYPTNIIDKALTGLFILAVIPCCFIAIRRIIKEIISPPPKNTKVKLPNISESNTYYGVWDSHDGEYDIDYKEPEEDLFTKPDGTPRSHTEIFNLMFPDYVSKYQTEQQEEKKYTVILGCEYYQLNAIHTEIAENHYIILGICTDNFTSTKLSNHLQNIENSNCASPYLINDNTVIFIKTTITYQFYCQHNQELASMVQFIPIVIKTRSKPRQFDYPKVYCGTLHSYHQELKKLNNERLLNVKKKSKSQIEMFGKNIEDYFEELDSFAPKTRQHYLPFFGGKDYPLTRIGGEIAQNHPIVLGVENYTTNKRRKLNNKA